MQTAPSTSIDRRRLLVAGGAALALAACRSSADSAPIPGSTDTGSSGDDVTASPATTTPADTTPASAVTAAATQPPASAPPASAGAAGAALTTADFDGLATCVLLPATTAGPFPLDEQFDRRDITEGYPGHPVRLGLRVVDGACTPVPGAVVEIWHTDATGDYSAFDDGGNGKDEGSGTTFLRGSQTADDAGIVEFDTIYPGWYPGRAVHIHLRVHLGDASVLTSQMFFDDAYTETVYAGAEYADNGLPDTTNATDNIAGDVGTNGTLLALTAGETSRGAGTIALLNLAVDA